ncbi:MAG: AAA family ATPase [Candidatus Micrarchaeia archaeon]
MPKFVSFIIAGTPGAGKTTVLAGAKLDEKGAKLINMGSEMLRHSKLQDRDKLRRLDAREQKRLRAKVINSLAKEKGLFVIDTHLSIKQGNIYLPGFSRDELHKLNVKSIIYIDANAKEILKRRLKDKSRSREQESEEEIEEQKSINLAMLSVAATELNIPVYIFNNKEGKAKEISKDIEKLFEEAVL